MLNLEKVEFWWTWVINLIKLITLVCRAITESNKLERSYTILIKQDALMVIPASMSSNWQTPVLGQRLGVHFTFAWDNDKNHKNHNNPHLNFVKGTVQY